MKHIKLILILLLVTSIFSRCDLHEDTTNMNADITLTSSGIAGDYIIPNISSEYYERTTLSNPINNWHIASETFMNSESKDINLKISFNSDKTYTVSGNFKMSSLQNTTDYVNATFDSKSFENSNSINLSGTFEVYQDTIISNIPRKGLLILTPGIDILSFEGSNRTPYFESNRSYWEIDVLQNNYIKAINIEHDFYHRWVANQEITIDVIKEK